MPSRLHRYYGSGRLHFITTSCYHRRPLLSSPRRRDFFLKMLEQMRKRYGVIVVGYVVMPEHLHLLISEPDRGTPSTVMQVLKQRFARHVLRDWRRRSRPAQGTLWAGWPTLVLVFLALSLNEGWPVLWSFQRAGYGTADLTRVVP